MVAQTVKNPPAMRETWVWSLGWEYAPEEGMAIHSSRTEELESYSPLGHKEPDKTATKHNTIYPKSLWHLKIFVQMSSNEFPKRSPGIASLLSVTQSCPTLWDPMDCSPPHSSVRGTLPGRNTRVGSHSLLQGIFPTQGSNPGLLHCRQILYCLSHQGNQSTYHLF